MFIPLSFILFLFHFLVVGIFGSWIRVAMMRWSKGGAGRDMKWKSYRMNVPAFSTIPVRLRNTQNCEHFYTLAQNFYLWSCNIFRRLRNMGEAIIVWT